MLHLSFQKKIQITKIFLFADGIFLFFWWPLSHWLYPDFYHKLLGFIPGSYPGDMVKIIGTCGVMPVLLLLFSAIHPVKNKDSIITVMVFAVLISLTYIYLIIDGAFPVSELINVVLSVFTVIFLLLFYPWNYTE